MRYAILACWLALCGCSQPQPDEILVRVESSHLVAYTACEVALTSVRQSAPAPVPAPEKKPDAKPDRKPAEDVRYLAAGDRSWIERAFATVLNNFRDDTMEKAGLRWDTMQKLAASTERVAAALDVLTGRVQRIEANIMLAEDVAPVVEADGPPRSYRLIVLSASWCGPCKAVDKQLRHMAKFGWKVGGKPDSDVQIVDVDEDTKTAKRYGSPMMTVPEFVIVDDAGTLVERGEMKLADNQVFQIELGDKAKLSPGILGVSEWLNLYRTGKRK